MKLATAVLATAFAGHAGAGGSKVNVVAERVAPIRTLGERTDPALLLVYVTDHLGGPLEGIVVSLSEGPRDRGRSTTGRDGTALLRLATAGSLTVRVAHEGFVAAEARQVVVRLGGFTAIALPLEVAQVADPLTAR
jgi:hypothetical protein